MLNELQIKAAVIQKLIDSKMLDDAVVINEMVISNWSRRADIAVANGRLYGYEIKSDYDTLKRLDGQISTYTQHFDKTTVIVTQKHLLAAIRRGRTTEISDINALYSHLTKTEINCFLRLSGAQVDSSWSRKQLIINGSHANVRRLREYVLSCLKRRYALTSEAFMAARMPITAPSDIRRLSKVKQFLDEPPRNAVPLQKPPAKPRPACPSAIKKIDLLKFEARYGEVPDGMPDVVLKRVRAVNSIQEAQARRLHLP
jgi:hypothetical protein